MNYGLSFLRGICSIGVVFYHYMFWAHDVNYQSMGSFFVYIFFIISALTLSIVYIERFSTGITYNGLVDFYIKRFSRLIPLLAAVSTTGLLYGLWKSGFANFGDNLARGYLTVTLLFGLQMPGLTSGTVAAWTLGIEAVFYAIFPAVVLLSNGARLSTMLFAMVILVVAQQSVLFILNDSINPDFFYRYANPLIFMPFFLSGMLLFRYKLSPSHFNTLMAVLLIFVIAMFTGVTKLEIYHSPLSYLFLTTLSVGVVLFSAGAKVPVKCKSIGKFLGDISYALYLTHWFIYKLVVVLMETQIMTSKLQPVVFAVLCVPVSSGVFYLFEKPATQWIRKKCGYKKVLT